MARRKTEAEKVATELIAEATKRLEQECDDIEDLIPNWSGEFIIMDVKDDGEWKRFRFTPESFIDARILAAGQSV